MHSSSPYTKQKTIILFLENLDLTVVKVHHYISSDSHTDNCLFAHLKDISNAPLFCFVVGFWGFFG